MTLASLSDAQLVARCRAGEEAAWNELVSRFSRYVFGIAVQAFRLSEPDAEDIFQECFARIYEHLDKLRDDDALRPWIGQLTRRLCIDRLRSGGREQPAEEEQLFAFADDEMSTLDEAMTVHEALATLSGDCREILDRFFAQDRATRQSATRSICPPARSRAGSPLPGQAARRTRREESGRGARLEDMAYEEERIARLLKALPPAPEGWVRAAQELPRSRRELDEIVARAEADAKFREALIADLESALATEGFEPDERTLDRLRERFAS